MSRVIRLVLIGLCLLTGQRQSQPAQAQSDYPSKPVKIIVPSAPGGGTDISARVLAQFLSQSMGQQFFIENRPGAGNMIGIEAVARSAPDGYTLLMTASTLTINHLTYKKVLYDTVRDFAPISLVVSLPSLLVVHPSVPARSLAELIALAKQKPDQLTYGSAGLGTNPHLSMELFKTMAGIEIRHIPYKGVGPALNDLIAGQVSSLIAGLLTTKPQVEAGTLRGLAVTGAMRAESLPNIPTVAEAGVPGYEALQWYGLLGAGRHAGGDRHAAACRDREGGANEGDEGAARRRRRRAGRQHAGGVRRAHPGRDEEMGGGGAGGEDRAAVSRSSATCHQRKSPSKIASGSSADTT